VRGGEIERASKLARWMGKMRLRRGEDRAREAEAAIEAERSRVSE